MQNEERINGLETQVRTLKRIVCLVCCLFGSTMFVGCTSGSLTVSDRFNKNDYHSVRVVAVSSQINDIQLGSMFEKLGYTVIGRNERTREETNLGCLVSTQFWGNSGRYEVKIKNARGLQMIHFKEEFKSIFNPGGTGFIDRIYKKLKPVLDISHN